MLKFKLQVFSRKIEHNLRAHELSFYLYGGLLASCMLFIISIFFAIRAPYSYEPWSQMTVFGGESSRSVMSRLYERGFIRSELLSTILQRTMYNDKVIKKGIYHLEDPKNLFQIFEAFYVDGPKKPLVQFTIPEGSDDKEIIAIVTNALPNITKEQMTKAISNASATGLLFPDTYYPDEVATAEDVIKTMTAQFVRTYKKEFQEDINLGNLTQSQKDHIVFAAILEGEVRKSYDMKLVAGILHNRIITGMKLQVDVDKWTYKNVGIPPSPINNPGLETLTAVMNPIATDYLFYLTGSDGRMYYAKTYEEHLINIRKYMR